MALQLEQTTSNSPVASPTSGQQQQSPTKRQQFGGRHQSQSRQPTVASKVGYVHSDLEQQKSRRYHDDDDNNNNNGLGNSSNNNNNNNYGSGSGIVRVLVTPATGIGADSNCNYGSSRQQIDRSATITTTTKTTTTKTKTSATNMKTVTPEAAQMDSSLQQLRSQQMEAAANRQKNYHHYDYYTDSDLTSSLATAAAPLQQQQQSFSRNNNYNDNYSSSNNYNYDRNILLFATEHGNGGYNNSDSPANSPQRSNGNQRQKQQVKQQQSNLPASYYGSNSAAGGSTSLLPTGKFISHYPSWRQQTQSPSLNHHQSQHQNYSFHVPLHLPRSSSTNFATNRLRHTNSHNNQLPQHYGNRQPNSHQHQTRYGYLALVDDDKVAAQQQHPPQRRYFALNSNSNGPNHGKSGRTSFSKSRTIAHLPDVGGRRCAEMALMSTPADRRPIINDDYEEDEYEQDYYDRPQLAARQYMLSEGDLLKVRTATILVDDGSVDNPFKPGTELSWEADMMVRLMRRGYPVQELPVLVEAAKKIVADGKSAEPRAGQRAGRRSRREQVTSTAADRKSRSGTLPPNASLAATSGEPSSELRRRLSSHELDAGPKQVWASSLSRAKSVPRFASSSSSERNKATGTTTTTSLGDADSIDRLITSIELEMAELMDSPEEGAGTQLRASEALNGDGKLAAEVGEVVKTKQQVKRLSSTAGGKINGSANSSPVGKMKIKRRVSNQDDNNINGAETTINGDSRQKVGKQKDLISERKAAKLRSQFKQDKQQITRKTECCKVQ